MVATRTPERVSTETVTRAGRVTSTPAWILRVPPSRATRREAERRTAPSVLLTANVCRVVEVCPWSSLAVTSSRHVPSAGGSTGAAGSSGAGGNVTGYVAGVRAPLSEYATTPPGAVSVAVTVEGRTTL